MKFLEARFNHWWLFLFAAIIVLITLGSASAQGALPSLEEGEVGIKVLGYELGYLIKLLLQFVALVAAVTGTGLGARWAKFRAQRERKDQEWFTKQVRSDELGRIFARIEHLVFDTVEYLAETKVETLKRISADGKITKKEIENLEKDAFVLVWRNLDAGSRELLEESKSDFKQLIINKIKARVRWNKGKHSGVIGPPPA